MLANLVSALTLTGIRFAHFGWVNPPEGEYGVYAEDSAGHFYADNKMSIQSTSGTIDLFTKSTNETSKNLIQSALNSVDCSWYLSSVQYETDTGYIHYEWIFEVS